MRFYLVNDINIYIFVESNNNNKHIMKKCKVREVVKLLEADGWVKLKSRANSKFCNSV